MESPRTPGAGITGALETLGSGISSAFVASAGLHFNDRRRLSAAALDRRADFLIFVGRHSEAERLAFRAAELRQAVAP